jgi:hypothetical protein
MKLGDEIVELTIYPEKGEAFHAVATANMQDDPSMINVMPIHDGREGQCLIGVRPLRSLDLENHCLDHRAAFAFGHVMRSMP